MDVEIRHLRILRAIAEAGSLARAAAALDMSQGSLSRHLQRLERSVGVPLLHRNHTGVTLTTAGELLLSGADKALPIVDRLLAAAKRHTETRPEAVLTRIGAMHSSVLPPLLKSVHQQLPDAEIALRIEETGMQLLDLLCDQQIDLALLRHYPHSDPPMRDTVGHTRIVDEPTLLAVGPSHRLAQCDTVGVQDLADERCVLPDADRHRLSRVFLSVCKEMGVQPRISYTSDTTAVEAMVHGTDAVSPVHSTWSTTDGLIRRRLRDPALTSQVLLAWTRDGAFAAHVSGLIDTVTREHSRAVE